MDSRYLIITIIIIIIMIIIIRIIMGLIFFNLIFIHSTKYDITSPEPHRSGLMSISV